MKNLIYILLVILFNISNIHSLDLIQKDKIDERTEEINNPIYSLVGLGMGSWMPTDDYKVMGNRMTFLLVYGLTYKRIESTFHVTIFSNYKSKNHEINYMNTSYNLGDMSGGSISIQIKYKIIDKNFYSISPLLGIGYQGFDNKNELNIDTLERVIGLDSKIYIVEDVFGKGYIGLEYKYNILNPKNNFNINTTGNSQTIVLYFGRIFDLFSLMIQ